MSEIQVIFLVGWLGGAAVTFIIGWTFRRSIKQWSARADMMKGPKTRPWLERNCTEREMQAVDFMILGQGSESDLAMVRKIAARAPASTARVIRLALGEHDR